MIPHTLAQESPTDELALFLVGEKKSGKSYTAATAPGTILFLDFDQRLAALRSHPNVKNVYGLTFADPTASHMVPTAFQEMLAVLNKLEQSPILSGLHESFKGLDKPVDTLVFDSVQTISDSARNYVLYHAGEKDGLARSFAIGQRVVRVPRSYAAWGSEMEMVTSAILQGRALLHCTKCWRSVTSDAGKMWHTDKGKYDHEPAPRAMNIICTLHEAAEEDPKSTEENPMFTGRITVYPVRYHRLLVYFNEVWRVTRTFGRVPQVTCDPDGKFIQAATALGISKITVPNIAQILRDAKSLQPQQTHNTNKG